MKTKNDINKEFFYKMKQEEATLKLSIGEAEQGINHKVEIIPNNLSCDGSTFTHISLKEITITNPDGSPFNEIVFIEPSFVPSYYKIIYTPPSLGKGLGIDYKTVLVNWWNFKQCAHHTISLLTFDNKILRDPCNIKIKFLFSGQRNKGDISTYIDFNKEKNPVVTYIHSPLNISFRFHDLLSFSDNEFKIDRCRIVGVLYYKKKSSIHHNMIISFSCSQYMMYPIRSNEVNTNKFKGCPIENLDASLTIKGNNNFYIEKGDRIILILELKLSKI